MRVYVAYNDWGDLIADAYSYESLIRRVRAAGYDEGDVIIGVVTP